MFKNTCKAILLLTVSLSLFSCKDRESADDQVFIPDDSETAALLSFRPGDPFFTDSVDVTVNGSAGSYYIFSLTAYEYLNGSDILKFTAIGIPLPGNQVLNSTDIYGIASYYDAEADKEYVSMTEGGGGMVTVNEYSSMDKYIRGIFEFTVVDSLSGNIITVQDGYFDTDVDTLY